MEIYESGKVKCQEKKEGRAEGLCGQMQDKTMLFN
jgi:hypothetical protein